MKKRNKKHNPNKLLNIMKSKVEQSHELWMSFDYMEVEAACTELAKQNLKRSEIIHKMYALHDGDLIVPHINHLSVDEYEFFLGMDSYYYCEKNGEVETLDYPLQFDLPKMTWEEFRNGGNPELKIIENGIKRRWKGLNQEVDDLDDDFKAKGYTLFKRDVYMKADVKFKSIETYNKFKAESIVRSMHRQYHLQEKTKVAV
jgi:hypothetical protein